jgi:hypothetical protein
MTSINPTETVLTGKWILAGPGRVVGDETCLRIEKLVHSYLELLGRDASGWDALYRDPRDKRLWELSYPQGELQGGGPPELRCLGTGEAREKYGAIVSL